MVTSSFYWVILSYSVLPKHTNASISGTLQLKVVSESYEAVRLCNQLNFPLLLCGCVPVYTSFSNPSQADTLFFPYFRWVCILPRRKWRCPSGKSTYKTHSRPKVYLFVCNSTSYNEMSDLCDFFCVSNPNELLFQSELIRAYDTRETKPEGL